jgi:pyruvate dehydrogenase E1 component
VNHKGQPTVLLVKTVKGFGMGKAGEGKNIAHQAKKLTDDDVRAFRDRFNIPIPDEKLAEIPFYKPEEHTPEMKYLHERRQALGGYLPKRRAKADEQLKVPALDAFKAVTDPTAEGREISTTQAYVRFLTALLRDKELGPRAVPILVDEARTFGMEGLFRQIGIYNPEGQKYTPVDKDQVMYYREDKAGQILQEGINEAGGMSSWIAAATSYSTNNRVMVPFYVYYSMFGFQRIGDLAWAAGDMQARGFLLGGTSGRTTLNGEGLQHEDGHSHILAGTIPNCISYDPTFAYEVVTIIREGMRRMYQEQEDVYYYVTLMNENYPHPGLADAGEGAEQGILKGLYKLKDGGKASEPSPKTAAKPPSSPKGSAKASDGRAPSQKLRVQLMGSGTILREVMAAAELLKADFGVTADVWSATSYNELRRDGMAAERWNLLHPTQPRRKSWIESCLEGHDGPVIASTDYMRNYADQVREHVQAAGRRYVVLGTDGFGRSDYRAKLRRFFEVDRHYVAVAALKALADDGAIEPAVVAEAIAKYAVDTERAAPWTV